MLWSERNISWHHHLYKSDYYLSNYEIIFNDESYASSYFGYMLFLWETIILFLI